MDGIRTGEQVWMARGKGVAGRADGSRMSIPRALREEDRAAHERSGGKGGTLRRLAAWWMQGWTAFVSVTGQPYLSLSGRIPADEPHADSVGGDEENEGKGADGRRCA